MRACVHARMCARAQHVRAHACVRACMRACARVSNASEKAFDFLVFMISNTFFVLVVSHVFHVVCFTRFSRFPSCLAFPCLQGSPALTMLMMMMTIMPIASRQFRRKAGAIVRAVVQNHPKGNAPCSLTDVPLSLSLSLAHARAHAHAHAHARGDTRPRGVGLRS